MVEDEISKLKEINRLCLEIIKDDCYHCPLRLAYVINRTLGIVSTGRRRGNKELIDPCKECPKSYVLGMAGKTNRWEKGNKTKEGTD